ASFVGEYLEGGRTPETLQQIHSALYHHARKDEGMRGIIEAIEGTEHRDLMLLEQRFRDRDHLARLLEAATEEIPEAFLIGQSYRREEIRDPRNMLRMLNSLWSHNES